MYLEPCSDPSTASPLDARGKSELEHSDTEENHAPIIALKIVSDFC